MTGVLNETQQQLVDLAREYAAEHIAPFAAEWDRSKTFPTDVLKKFGVMGFSVWCCPRATTDSASTR